MFIIFDVLFLAVDSLRTPTEVRLELGRRIRQLRLARDWRLATLSERAGLSLPTLHRFETTGRITLDNLLKLADALGRLGELETLFRPPTARSLEQLERATVEPQAKRGRR
jgi:transcriptional regulator with XRE-family HTH domain